ncbi:2-dehydro-3-deoxy-D-gluconate 5-dehydrogenase KduD [Colwellia sp. 20A7]|uniref:2-dehydro-3-deoxy-D-gluconate 5-dehydrogenase KduD n=1 Tax=Colwellia sp. 20A7 TaxID=2689569 RepID=UPI001357DDBC|nr:2-dehydro-3-deoxy-D-gluconate 5-dehydrogenase KduD [Colwellia sp. 20A7]
MSNPDLSLFSLEGKTALVTGASRGLGQAIAIGLAKAGATVICSSSKNNGTLATEKIINDNGGKAYSISADLSDQDAIHSMVEEAFSLTGTIDILVNNGGTISRYPADKYPLNEWQKVIDVNLSAVFLLSQLVGIKMLEKQQGKIINIASMLSFTGGITVPAYTASKHGVVGITKALANEWASKNIQVNAIAPGYFRTDNTQALQDNPERNTDIEKRIPAGKWGEPEQLVGAVTFLASSASDYVNGHILAVDGGWLAR